MSGDEGDEVLLELLNDQSFEWEDILSILQEHLSERIVRRLVPHFVKLVATTSDDEIRVVVIDKKGKITIEKRKRIEWENHFFKKDERRK